MSDLIPTAAPFLLLVCSFFQHRLRSSMTQEDRLRDARFLKYSSALTLSAAAACAIIKLLCELGG